MVVYISCTSIIIDPKRLLHVVAIKIFFTPNEAILSSLFVDHDEGTISKFATEMHQANRA